LGPQEPETETAIEPETDTDTAIEPEIAAEIAEPERKIESESPEPKEPEPDTAIEPAADTDTVIESEIAAEIAELPETEQEVEPEPLEQEQETKIGSELQKPEEPEEEPAEPQESEQKPEETGEASAEPAESALLEGESDGGEGPPTKNSEKISDISPSEGGNMVDSAQNIDKMGMVGELCPDGGESDADELVKFAFLRLQSGMLEEAAEYFYQAIEKRPGRDLEFKLVIELCQIYRALGSVELALDILENYRDNYRDQIPRHDLDAMESCILEMAESRSRPRETVAQDSADVILREDTEERL
jgi:tetratricopeptide (TPR) repeat protein